MQRPARFLTSAALAAKNLILLLENRRPPSRATCREYLSPRYLQRKQIIARGMTNQDPRSGRKRGRGQPTKFREEYVEQVRALCEAGVRDEEIAAYLGVSSRSLHRWQDRWPRFFEARRPSPRRSASVGRASIGCWRPALDGCYGCRTGSRIFGRCTRLSDRRSSCLAVCLPFCPCVRARDGGSC